MKTVFVSFKGKFLKVQFLNVLLCVFVRIKTDNQF